MKAAVVILLLQVNLLLATRPAGAQQTQTSTPPAQTAPEAPAPATQGATAAPPSLAQQMQQAQQPSFAPPQPFDVPMPHSHNPLFPYMPSTAPELDLINSPRLENLIREGKIYVSLRDAIAVAIENNLDLAYFRYNFPIAQTDILRTKAGSPANGVNTAIVQGTQGGFALTGGGGGSSGSGFSAGNGGIVTSTLGAGTSVSSFDPYLTFKGYVDHTVSRRPTQFLTGVPVLKNNTIQVLSSYSQSFPIGTGVQINYLGQRVASNTPYNSINPELYSNFQVTVPQPILAGFGIATNERFIRIAKRNSQITRPCFQSPGNRYRDPGREHLLGPGECLRGRTNQRALSRFCQQESL